MTTKASGMRSNKPSHFYGLTLMELTIATLILSGLVFNSTFFKTEQDLLNLAARPSAETIQSLSDVHNEIDALPIAPEVREQMLIYIEVAEFQIQSNDMSSAREAVLDFSRKIELYRYQIGHAKIDRLFNTAMAIAVDIHNASINN